MTADASKLNLFLVDNADKVPYAGSFDHQMGAATLSGGLYLPKHEVIQINNPWKKKALFTLAWSIDGVNYYPNKPHIYNPGNPPSEGVGASVGMSLDEEFMYFYFIHYLGTTVDFNVKWVLDTLS